jgi:cobyrinic acid a,c-diamide synthase
VVRETIEGICGLPVLGAIPKLPADIFPERHLGLIPPQETAEVEGPLARVQEVAEQYLDLDGILDLARTAPSSVNNHDELPQEGDGTDALAVSGTGAGPDPRAETGVRIGVFRDAAFQFYYPENLEQLVQEGAELVEISPIEDPALPEVDALYLGGGFPETLASQLSENLSFMKSVREAAEAGLPIYAECGGAVYLGESLHYEGRTFPLVGVLPVEYGFRAKPKGHGYTVLETVTENPFFPRGSNLRGHEFHYTYLLSPGDEELEFAFRMHRGYGFDGQHDGLRRFNVLASYTHVHALGAVGWASRLVRVALRYKQGAAD